MYSKPSGHKSASPAGSALCPALSESDVWLLHFGCPLTCQCLSLTHPFSSTTPPGAALAVSLSFSYRYICLSPICLSPSPPPSPSSPLFCSSSCALPQRERLSRQSARQTALSDGDRASCTLRSLQQLLLYDRQALGAAKHLPYRTISTHIASSLRVEEDCERSVRRHGDNPAPRGQVAEGRWSVGRHAQHTAIFCSCCRVGRDQQPARVAQSGAAQRLQPRPHLRAKCRHHIESVRV